VSILIGGTLAFLTAASAAQLGAGVGTMATSSDRSIIVDAAVDSLLRPPTAEVAAADTPAMPAPRTPSPAAGPSPGPSSAQIAQLPADSREAINRTITAAVADGKLSVEDRRYLAQVVASRTGVPAAEAERRVDEVYAKAMSAVETARKAAVAAGLATATALLLGLAAAWYAAQRGGRHRDQNIPAKFRLGGPFTRRGPVAQPPT